MTKYPTPFELCTYVAQQHHDAKRRRAMRRGWTIADREAKAQKLRRAMADPNMSSVLREAIDAYGRREKMWE